MSVAVVLVLFTRERGKLAVVAKGVRRISSRMAGHLELFTQSDLLADEFLVLRRGKKSWHVVQFAKG